MHRNKLAFYLAIFGGFLMLLSGTTGVAGLLFLEQLILGFINSVVIRYVFLVLLIIASFGGFAVFLGGYLILKSRVRLGRFIIMLGSGAGILSLVINGLLIFANKQASMAWFLSSATLGIIFSVAAQVVSRPKKLTFRQLIRLKV
jgi:hypothetical protein